MKNRSRHDISKLSVLGNSYLVAHQPYMVAWWSAAFPGFGHYLLNQYMRGLLLALLEVIVNSMAHLNEAMVYSFCGRFDKAASVLQPDWSMGYIVIYFFAMWDSYRSAITQTKMAQLAEAAQPPVRRVLITPMEVQYVERKNPAAGVFYSFFFPGLGQLYNHRFGLAFYSIFWWWIYSLLSHFYRAVLALMLGHVPQSTAMLDPQWLLFMPSVVGGSMYHAYVTTLEQNELFRKEQRQYFKARYGASEIDIWG
ncbi:hypothetical protein [Cohnella nanjingensis]|uniref:Uncharacterized protein n=1 Tax=Cohnella nanjingensis TaxID=1387779 RepID=A0A7X0RP36_9BACL|nr:hypothetical protein [Cohnella nanjingensis]MBB6669634.1 hypothetical protein [Cohnella nanjingensis]